MRAPFLAAALAASLAMPAVGQVACGPRAALVEQLSSQYGETRQAIAMQGQAVIEFWANPATGTWTVIMTLPGQPTCAVAAGQSWEATAALPGDPA